jgi:hypothetical protein
VEIRIFKMGNVWNTIYGVVGIIVPIILAIIFFSYYWKKHPHLPYKKENWIFISLLTGLWAIPIFFIKKWLKRSPSKCSSEILPKG